MVAPYDQGIYDGIPAADYIQDRLRDEPTLSRSGIHTILNSTMADFAAGNPRLRNPDWPDPEPDDTDANILGSVVHASVLGGNGGAKYIVGDPSEHVIPSSKTGERYATWSGAAKSWKQAREAEGYKVINYATNAKAAHIAGHMTAALEERFGRSVWVGRKVEQTLIWRKTLDSHCQDAHLCHHLGECWIYMRARPDAILPGGTIVDIKTTALGLSDVELGKRIALDGLDIQCEVYREGALAVELGRATPPPVRPPFVFAWIKTLAPFTVRFVDLERCGWPLSTTRMAIDVAAHRFGACLKSGIWSDAPPEAEPVCPQWFIERRGLMLLEAGLMGDGACQD